MFSRPVSLRVLHSLAKCFVVPMCMFFVSLPSLSVNDLHTIHSVFSSFTALFESYTGKFWINMKIFDFNLWLPLTRSFSLSQIAVMTLTLFPIRLLFAAFMMLLAWPFAFVATVGRSEDAVEPLSWWRW